ncbi:alpha-1,4-glucan lyase, partial [Fusarium bulbicola]
KPDLPEPKRADPHYFEPGTSNFNDTSNNKQAFQGDVFYNRGNGHPDHYPNLNNKDATSHGLNNIDKISDPLKWREDRPNFIIGRGSFVRSHRFAGLWTGDNASTWEFIDITVAQVLALGMSRVTISGQDFQEPYAYQKHYEDNRDRYQGREAMLYGAVLPVCKYQIRLRYSLMQLLDDAMFSSMITGLPIARAMNQFFTRSRYMVRNDLLFAPALTPGSKRQIRKLCFPYPDKWYSMNLRPDEPLDAPLLSVAEGGSRISYNCQFSDEEKQMPYITLIYIREGVIIPKIGVRDYIPDHSLPRPDANPITLHIYPGKDSASTMNSDLVLHMTNHW